MKNRLQLFLGSLIVIAILVWLGVFSSYKADNNSVKNLKVYFLNVGQGDSEYIKFPNGQDALIDGGPDSSVLTELGKVMDFGDRKIDLIILTHPHADHLTGLISVINRFEIGEVWQTGVGYPSATYDEFNKLVKEKNIASTDVSLNSNKDFGLAKLSVLAPLSNLKNSKIDNVNNASIVNKLEFGNFSALFLADLEKDVQAQILNQIKLTNVIKVGHHGSSNALNEDLYNIARPNVVVIEVGAKNTYGHPHETVISFLKSIATQIYRTDQNGIIKITSDGVNWQVN